jgi:hypothetical protein
LPAAEGEKGEHRDLAEAERQPERRRRRPGESHRQRRGEEEYERQLDGVIGGEPGAVPGPEHGAVESGTGRHRHAEAEPVAEQVAAGDHLRQEAVGAVQQLPAGGRDALFHLDLVLFCQDFKRYTELAGRALGL